MAAQTYQEGGRGRKQCPRCKIYMPVVYAACPKCHLLFEKKQEAPPSGPKAVVKRAEKKAATYVNSRISGLRIPDGHNPVPLLGIDKRSLLRWAEAVREYWLKKGYWLVKEGLCYYLEWEPQVADNPKVLDLACQVINDNLSDDFPEPR